MNIPPSNSNLDASNDRRNILTPLPRSGTHTTVPAAALIHDLTPLPAGVFPTSQPAKPSPAPLNPPIFNLPTFSYQPSDPLLRDTAIICFPSSSERNVLPEKMDCYLVSIKDDALVLMDVPPNEPQEKKNCTDEKEIECEEENPDPEFNSTPLVDKIIELSNGELSEEYLEKMCSNVHISMPTELSGQIDEKFFANLFGDAIIHGSHLEGASSQENLAILLHFLQNIPASQSPELKNLCLEFEALMKLMIKMDSINQSQEAVDHLAHEIVAQLKQMKVGDTFLFPGGWTGKPGHFILYKFTRCEKNFSLKIINTGAGLNYHPTLVKDKIVYQPWVEVKEIPLTVIWSPNFWKTTILRTIKDRSSKPAEAKEIYEDWVSLLEGKWVTIVDTINYSFSIFIKPQASGTCSVRVFLAYIKECLGIVLAKELIFQIKFWTLANYYVKNVKPLNYSDWMLRNCAASALAKAALYRNKRLSPHSNPFTHVEDLIKIYTLTTAVVRGCQEFRTNYASNSRNFYPPLKVSPEHSLVKNVLMTADILDPSQEPNKDKSVKTKRQKTIQKENPSVDLPKFPTLQDWSVSISPWIKFLEHFENRKAEEVSIYMHYLIQSLPVPTVDGTHLEIFRKPAAVTKDLRSLAQIHLRLGNLFNKEDRFPANRVIDLMHLFALADSVAQKGILARHKFDIFNLRLHLPLLNFFFPKDKNALTMRLSDAIDQQRALALENYFSTRNRSDTPALFNYHFNQNSECTIEIKQGVEHTCGDFILIQAVREQQQQFFSNLKMKYTNLSWPAFDTYLFSAKHEDNPVAKEYFDLRDIFFFYCRSFSIRSSRKISLYMNFPMI